MSESTETTSQEGPVLKDAPVITAENETPASNAPSSTDDSEILSQYEAMFATRYTTIDPSYLQYATSDMDPPPIVENYSVRGQRPNWNESRKRSYNEASHYDNQGYNQSREDNWKQRRHPQQLGDYHHQQDWRRHPDQGSRSPYQHNRQRDNRWNDRSGGRQYGHPSNQQRAPRDGGQEQPEHWVEWT